MKRSETFVLYTVAVCGQQIKLDHNVAQAEIEISILSSSMNSRAKFQA